MLLECRDGPIGGHFGRSKTGSLVRRLVFWVGQDVEVAASSAYVDGRLHRFTVSARHLGGDGKVVGSAEVTRVVVDAERFLGRLG